jgi:hypothetical protein
MTDYYLDLLQISRKYVGFAAPRFVKIVFQQIGASPKEITEDDVRNFAKEIDMALGKSLSKELKEQFKEEVLQLIKEREKLRNEKNG